MRRPGCQQISFIRRQQHQYLSLDNTFGLQTEMGVFSNTIGVLETSANCTTFSVVASYIGNTPISRVDTEWQPICKYSNFE